MKGDLGNTRGVSLEGIETFETVLLVETIETDDPSPTSHSHKAVNGV
jgi:hypothetical protein